MNLSAAVDLKTPGYYPLTAVPFENGWTYKEVLPCGPLRPYIRCYWGSEFPYCHAEKKEPRRLVIPDTCVDIMYHIDYTANQVTGGFCGINDRSFYAHNSFLKGHKVASFCIRFFAWSAYVFSEDAFADTVNGFFDVRSRFSWLDKALRDNLFELYSLQEKIAFTESLFLKRLGRIKLHSRVDCAINAILANNGSLGIEQLSKDTFLSSRQLERVFHEYVGITPKKLSNLVRYQTLWRDILSNPDFDILDAVWRYGYSDQPHLMREFKRYHSMDITSARELAMKHVGNIQEKDTHH